MWVLMSDVVDVWVINGMSPSAWAKVERAVRGTATAVVREELDWFGRPEGGEARLHGDQHHAAGAGRDWPSREPHGRGS